MTARVLQNDGVAFRIVIEEKDEKKYQKHFEGGSLLVVPFEDKGVTAVRNWIKDHSIKEGAQRHWQLDDNISWFMRALKGHRYRCRAGVALSVCEDLTDRYDNVAVSGLNYDMFGFAVAQPPFYVNNRVYSCSLILNSIPHRWRPFYNEDTDLCLQVLADGWCKILLNAFCAKKIRTMIKSGGNTPNYQSDGRLRMARSLAKDWPRVVSVKRRFRRPQHVVRNAWRKFDTPLRLKPGVDLSKIEPNDYGLRECRYEDLLSGGHEQQAVVRTGEDEAPEKLRTGLRRVEAALEEARRENVPIPEIGRPEAERLEDPSALTIQQSVQEQIWLKTKR